MNICDMDRLIGINEVCRLLSRSKASIYRDIKRGTFPSQIKVGCSAKWRMSEVDKIIKKPPEK